MLGLHSDADDSNMLIVLILILNITVASFFLL